MRVFRAPLTALATLLIAHCLPNGTLVLPAAISGDGIRSVVIAIENNHGRILRAFDVSATRIPTFGLQLEEGAVVTVLAYEMPLAGGSSCDALPFRRGPLHEARSAEGGRPLPIPDVVMQTTFWGTGETEWVAPKRAIPLLTDFKIEVESTCPEFELETVLLDRDGGPIYRQAVAQVLREGVALVIASHDNRADAFEVTRAGATFEAELSARLETIGVEIRSVVASTSSTSLDFFFGGPQGSLQRVRKSLRDGSWSGPEMLAPGHDHRLAQIAGGRNGQRFEIFAVDDSGEAWYWPGEGAVLTPFGLEAQDDDPLRVDARDRSIRWLGPGHAVLARSDPFIHFLEAGAEPRPERPDGPISGGNLSFDTVADVSGTLFAVGADPHAPNQIHVVFQRESSGGWVQRESLELLFLISDIAPFEDRMMYVGHPDAIGTIGVETCPMQRHRLDPEGRYIYRQILDVPGAGRLITASHYCVGPMCEMRPLAQLRVAWVDRLGTRSCQALSN